MIEWLARRKPSTVMMAASVWIIAVVLLSSKPWEWDWVTVVVVGPLYALMLVLVAMLWRLSRLLDKPRD